MVQSVMLCIVTRNRALNVMTLHSAMNFHLYCMSRNINLQITFIHDRNLFHKHLKSCSSERIILFDYGVSLSSNSVDKLMGDFPDGYRVVVVPCFTENVDWDAFKKKTRGF